MKDVYTKALELLGKNEFCVLATIIRLTGSGPRGAGTKFLILEDGTYVGTIGGGLLEARVLEAAKKVFTTRSPMSLSLNLMGKDVAETDMICGGDVDIFLEPLHTGAEDQIQAFRKILDIHKRGGAGILVTVVNVDRWEKDRVPRLFLLPDTERIGNLPGMKAVEVELVKNMPLWLKQREPRLVVSRDDLGGGVELFVEPILSDPVLYIFGGGHVSAQIIPLASKVGFKVEVIDDRPEFADAGKFPDAAKVHQYAFDGVAGKIPVDESSYLVIVTRGHIHDKTVLEQCLRTKAKYIGMIGSRRKKAMIYEKLLEEGFTKSDLDRVHAPIGLDIGAETPEEIAVSIVAELIQVRAGKEA
ncbi:MAG: xanthine and dehydrogenase maturation factor [Deltaproteobacteria bacterium]|nr:xanthine and dehydrogenase maturation factor [Deltaproteobacteria bacterium]